MVQAITLSSGRPATVLDSFRFAPEPGRPGLYRAAPGWRVDVLVIAELPRTRETLLLRLLGARAVLRGAIRDLRTRPEDAWERSIALPWLVRLRFETPADPSAREAEDAEEADRNRPEQSGSRSPAGWSISFDAADVIVHKPLSGRSATLPCMGRTAHRALRPGLESEPLHRLYSLGSLRHRGRRGREGG